MKEKDKILTDSTIRNTAGSVRPNKSSPVMKSGNILIVLACLRIFSMG